MGVLCCSRKLGKLLPLRSFKISKAIRPAQVSQSLSRQEIAIAAIDHALAIGCKTHDLGFE